MKLPDFGLKTYLYVGGALAILGVTGWIYASGRSDEAAVQKPKVETATDLAVKNGLETQGAQESTARVGELMGRERRVQENTHAFIADTRSRPTAPLDPAVAARLRAHDRILCDESPALCAPDGATAGDDAGRRSRVL